MLSTTVTNCPTTGNRQSLSSLRFLIIAGTSKAGTTSVFNYFARHPQICPAQKETRFFLDPDYPLSSKSRYGKDGLDAYLSQFSCKERQSTENWRFEATPDYLYSPGCAEGIQQTLKNIRLLFILREPISRLISWYRFARKRGEIPGRMTFDEYVNAQIDDSDDRSRTGRHPAWYALQHGLYSHYLRQYLQHFGHSAISIFFYEDLLSDPLKFVDSLCDAVGLDKAYFQNYKFGVINKGSDVRNRRLHAAYVRTKEGLRTWARKDPHIYSLLKRVYPRVDGVYESVNVLRNAKLEISDPTKNLLDSYYAGETARLTELLGITVPWSSQS